MPLRSTCNLAFDPGMAHGLCRDKKKTLFGAGFSVVQGSVFTVVGSFHAPARLLVICSGRYGEDVALFLFPQCFTQLIELLLLLITCPC